LGVAKNSSNQNPSSKIAEYRQNAGLTQLELAESVGVTEATIANWESGRSGGVEWIRNVVLLCETLDCELSDLLEQDLGELRKKAELTQRSLSKVFGVRENTIAAWEKSWNAKGNAYKRVEYVARLCHALGCRPNELVPSGTPKKRGRASKRKPLPTERKPLPTEVLIQNFRRQEMPRSSRVNRNIKHAGDSDIPPSSVTD
jgi:transcriptional regulator with XRE-family HTH domain